MSSKEYLSWDEYTTDIEDISNNIKDLDNLHLVSIYRGSLGIGAHLSNILDAPLSIVKFQSYDGEDKKVELLHNAGIKELDNIVILDDIYDTGSTMKKVYDYFYKECPKAKISSFTIYGKPGLARNNYTRLHSNNWIVFPWEK